MFFLASYNKHFTPGSLDVDGLSEHVFVTNISITGSGFIDAPLPFQCYCCKLDVQVRFGCMSSSLSRSATLLHSYKVNLHNLSNRARI